MSIFDAAARGATLGELVKMADRIGLRGKYGTRITKPTMQHIVRNRAYTGMFEWGGEEWIGKYEPLMSRDLYDRVQRALAEGSKPKSRIHTFAYAGILRCAACGGLLTGDRKKGRYVYYSCRGARSCKRFWPESAFDDRMLELLGSFRADADASDAVAAHITGWYDDVAAKESQRATIIRKRIEEVDRLQAASYEEKLLGRITEEMWRAVSSRWGTEAEGLRAELATIQPAIGRAELLRLALAPFELLQTAQAQYLTRDAAEKGRLVKTCCSNFLVTDGSISIQLRSPFDVLAKFGECTDWLGRVDSNHRMPAPKAGALPLGDSPTKRVAGRKPEPEDDS